MFREKKKLVFEIVLCWVVLVAGVIYLQRLPLRNSITLTLTLRVSHHQPDTFQIQTGTSTLSSRLQGTGAWETLSFTLPAEKIDQLDILLGPTPGVLALKAVTLEAPLATHTFSGKKLKTLFQIYPSSAPYSIKKENLQLKTTSILHWMRVQKPFLTALHRLQQNKIIYYLLLVLVVFLCFYLLHNLDFRVLGIFCHRRLWLSGLGIWLLLLYFPLLDDTFKIMSHGQLVERRLIHKKPELQVHRLPQYLKSYTAFYNDNFAPRSELIFLNSYFKFRLFGISATEKVLVGRENWLFYHRNVNMPSAVEYYRNLEPFSQQQLEAWRKVLEERQSWLARRGIAYLFLIVPNKNTIYPEYMPEYIFKASPHSRMDQLLAYLNTHTTLSLPDLRPALLAAKGPHLLYYRTDTHWNEYGAFFGHQELFNYIATAFPRFKDLPRIPSTRFSIQPVTIDGGDLAEMMSLHDSLFREKNLELLPNPPWSYTTQQLPDLGPFVRQVRTENPQGAPHSLLMVHDSFYLSLKPFLAETFSRCRFIWDWGVNFYPELIAEEKPALVIDEMAERFLLNKIPLNPRFMRSEGQ